MQPVCDLSLRHVLVLMFTGIVLAMALCLVGQLRAVRPMSRGIALLTCIGGLLGGLAIASAAVIHPYKEFAVLIEQLPEAARILISSILSSIDRVSDAIYGIDTLPDLKELGSAERRLIPDGSSLLSGVGRVW